MVYLVSSILPFLTAILVCVGTTLIWRNSIDRLFIYCVIAFFMALGMFSLSQFLVEIVKAMWPMGEGYYLVSKMTPEQMSAMERQRLNEGFVIAVVVVLLSYPLLMMLKNGLAK